jgi:peptidoglycan/xylan/chitin deacetylase (PgdA/CDA1 family)
MQRHFSIGLLILVLFGVNSIIWYVYFQDHSTGQPVASSAVIKEPLVQQEQTTPKAKQAVHSTPILMYHYIRDYKNPDDPLGEQLSVSPDTLRKQLQTIKSAGYEPIPLEDFINKKFPKKPIILTFDDGYADHYSAAFQILKEYNMIGTFFIVKGFVNSPGYITDAQLQEMEKEGMEIAGHSVTHRNLATASYEIAIAEISVSMQGRSPVFAYPAGKYGEMTLDIVSGLGIKAAVTTNVGIATEKSPIYELPRIRIKENTDILKTINELSK